MPDAHEPTGQGERETPEWVFARLIAPDAQRYDGSPSLFLSLAEVVGAVIRDVYADSGDSSPDVLSSNIAHRLEHLLRSALPHLSAGRPIAEEAIEDAISNHLSGHLTWRDGDADGSDHWIECPVPELSRFIVEHLSTGQNEADTISQLRSELDWHVDHAKAVEEINQELRKVIEQVRALHTQEWVDASDEAWGRPGRCCECRVEWPCPTLALLPDTPTKESRES